MGCLSVIRFCFGKILPAEGALTTLSLQHGDCNIILLQHQVKSATINFNWKLLCVSKMWQIIAGVLLTASHNDAAVCFSVLLPFHMPQTPKSNLLFASFIFVCSSCPFVKQTRLNGTGYETKLRDATGAWGTTTECRALLLIMVLIKRLLDATGLGRSMEESNKKQKRKRQMEDRGEQD